MLETLQNLKLDNKEQQHSLENVLNIGIPTMKQEEWKYTYYNKILQNNFDINGVVDKKSTQIETLRDLVFPENQKYKLVFIDGTFNEELSSFPQSHKFTFYNSSNIENSNTKDFLVEFNNALVTDGIYIEIADGFMEEENIGIYYISTTVNHLFNLKNRIKIGKNVQVRFTEYFINPTDISTYYNIVTSIFVDEHAVVNWDKIQDGGELYYLTDNTFVEQKNTSVFTVNTITISGNIVRNNLVFDINGEYCEANMNGLYLLHGHAHCDNRIRVNHNQPNSNSNELYKGILGDHSVGVFNGKIVVAQDAQKTNAFQSNRNLLLTNDASIYTKPNLEIFADDVKCSHGATSSQIEDSELFYLQARGIGKEMARNLLTLAFAGEILEKLKADNKQYIESKIYESLGIEI